MSARCLTLLVDRVALCRLNSLARAMSGEAVPGTDPPPASRMVLSVCYGMLLAVMAISYSMMSFWLSAPLACHLPQDSRTLSMRLNADTPVTIAACGFSPFGGSEFTLSQYDESRKTSNSHMLVTSKLLFSTTSFVPDWINTDISDNGTSLTLSPREGSPNRWIACLHHMTDIEVPQTGTLVLNGSDITVLGRNFTLEELTLEPTHWSRVHLEDVTLGKLTVSERSCARRGVLLRNVDVDEAMLTLRKGDIALLHCSGVFTVDAEDDVMLRQPRGNFTVTADEILVEDVGVPGVYVVPKDADMDFGENVKFNVQPNEDGTLTYRILGGTSVDDQFFVRLVGDEVRVVVRTGPFGHEGIRRLD